MKNIIFDRILSSLETELHKRYEISSTIRHRGEKGRQRENGLAVFLKEYLPSAYGVATGELISIEGSNLSPQCDLIIYDRLITPIIGKYDAVQQVLISGTYCVIEVKSAITKSNLKDTEQKFTKIRKLNLSQESHGKKQFGPTFFVFGYRLETNVSECKDFIVKHSQEEDLAVVALDTGMTVWVGPKDNSMPARPAWLHSTNFKNGIYGTLALFYTMVLEVCQDTKLPKFDFKKSIMGLGKST